MSARFWWIALGVAAVPTTAGAEDPRYVRDWQVERPLTSGLLKGLTWGLLPASGFGEGARAASASDPFGASALVHDEVRRLSARSNRVGAAAGYGFWVFCAAGAIHRRRRLAEASALETARVA